MPWTALSLSIAAALAAPSEPELLALCERDQAARGDGAVESPEDVERESTAALRAALDAELDLGGLSDQGIACAWLLVQHSAELELQRSALERLAPIAASGRLPASSLALLEDRVRLRSGLPQRYGSQFFSVDEDRMRLLPVTDLAGLDARRAEVGLEPIAEYAATLREVYGAEVELEPLAEIPAALLAAE